MRRVEAAYRRVSPLIPFSSTRILADTMDDPSLYFGAIQRMQYAQLIAKSTSVLTVVPEFRGRTALPLPVSVPLLAVFW